MLSFDKRCIVYDHPVCAGAYKQEPWFVVFVAILYISILQMSFLYLLYVI